MSLVPALKWKIVISHDVFVTFVLIKVLVHHEFISQSVSDPPSLTFGYRFGVVPKLFYFAVIPLTAGHRI